MGKKLSAKEPTYSEKGCELWPTCLGNDKYPQCPFSVCFEDLTDSEGELYDEVKVVALRRWFLKEIK